MKKRIATYVDKRRMEELMALNSVPGKDAGTRVWKPGWSFKLVAQSVDPTLTRAHARRLADELGFTFEDPPPLPLPAERLDTLEAAIEDLRQKLSTLYFALNVLMEERNGPSPGNQDEERHAADTSVSSGYGDDFSVWTGDGDSSGSRGAVEDGEERPTEGG